MFRKVSLTTCLSIGLLASATIAAEARVGFRGGGFHRGFGGFHPGFGGGFRPGFAGGFRHRGWGPGWDYGALGGGLVIGSLAYAYPYPYRLPPLL